MNSNIPVDRDVEAYLHSSNVRIQTLALAIRQILVTRGCHEYLKTIYVGYELNGEMVAALYKRNGYIEVALALAEDHLSDLLVDAAHLKWRTLPLSAIIRSESQLSDVEKLIDESCSRVELKRHHVFRDNDFYTRRGRRR